MDDKTATIPSLKDFKNNKSSSKSNKSGSKNKTPRRSALSQDTMRLEKIKSASVASRKPSDKSGNKTGTAQRASGTQSRSRSASAPSTYARDRVKSSSDYDSSRRVDRSGQAQRKADMASNAKKPAQSRGQRVSSYYDDVPQRSTTQRSGINKPSTASAPKRPAQSSTRQPQKARPQTAPKRKPATQKPVPKKKKPLSLRAKKFRKAVGFTVLGLVLALVLLILSLTVFFKAKDFEVNGIERYTKKDIVNASGLYVGDNIFSANKNRAEDRIEQMYPYVEEADVYSIFPNKFGIDLKMAKPAAKINAMGGIHIISDKGKVLEVRDSADDVAVPFIEGIQIKARAEGEFVDFGSDVLERALEEMFSANSQLNATKINEINIITREDVFELRFVHDDRIVVYMGIPEDIGYKMQVAEKIIADLDKAEGTAVMGELDVSTCNGEDARSYFNPYSILGPDTTAPQTTTEPLEEPTMAYEY